MDDDGESRRLDPEPLLARVERARAAQVNVKPLEPMSVRVSDIEDLPGATIEERRREQWIELMPARFVDAAMGDLRGDPAITEQEFQLLSDWAQNPAQRNLVLAGAIGTGKTYAAAAAARERHMAGMDVRFIPAVELLDMLRPPAEPERLYDLAEIDVLVIDDIGSERSTEWTIERMYQLVNRRWLEQLPIVATTNVQTRMLFDHYGEPMMSRLMDGALAIELTGPDRRLL